MNQKLKEIKNDLDAISERLTMLAKEEEEKDEIICSHIPGYYQPAMQGRYYYPNIICPTRSYIKYWQNDSTDRYHQLLGICCQTEEEAEFVREQKEAYQTLIMRIKELNAGWVPDRENTDQDKYFFHLFVNKLQIDWVINSQIVAKELYFKSEEIGNQLITELGEDLIELALWGIQ
jgi:hypothetical protein